MGLLLAGGVHLETMGPVRIDGAPDHDKKALEQEGPCTKSKLAPLNTMGPLDIYMGSQMKNLLAVSFVRS